MIAAHFEQWQHKSLHGQWPQRMTADSFQWLQSAHLKPVTEALITAAQDQALYTLWLGYHILRTIDSDLCRRCGQYPETIEHIVAGCPRMAQSVYLEKDTTQAVSEIFIQKTNAFIFSGFRQLRRLITVSPAVEKSRTFS